MRIKFKDITGFQFGRLTAQWPVGKNKDMKVCWLCSCECGKLKVINMRSLLRNLTTSCGCYSNELSGSRGRKLFTIHGKSQSLEGLLLYSAAERARKYNIPFNIGIDDIIIPENCPLLGTPLRKERGKGHHQDSPSIDRIIPSLGYTKENVQVVSVRANQLKSNASLEEMKLLVKNWEGRS